MTPRYWALMLLQQHYGGGAGTLWPTYSNTQAVFAQAFASPARTLLLVNKLSTAQTVGLTADWTDARMQCVDQSSMFEPATASTLTDHTNLPLLPFAVCVLTYPAGAAAHSA